MGKNIVVISNFFEYELSYQEAQIADALHRMGHNVTVVTTNRSQHDQRKRVEETDFPYQVIRLNKLIKISTTIFYIFYNRNLLEGLNPDYVFLIHPTWGLPYFLMKAIPSETGVISIFGDYENFSSSSLKNKLSQKLVKDYWARKTIRRSDIVVANTNKTVSILSNKIRNKEHLDKIIMTGLGYNKTRFFYNEKKRKEKRTQMGLTNKRVVITVTRMVEYKNILSNIQPVLKALRENKDLIYMLVGFDHSDYSKYLKKQLRSLDVSHQLILKDFVEPEELNELLNISDFGYWYRPSISIQQAMGTGLFVLLPNYDYEDALDHLIANEKSGYFFESHKDLTEKLKTLNNGYNRPELHEINTRFSYESILEDMISLVGNLDPN
jgi:glycosyltransferase involved in cell wall biosynthesis